MADTGNTIALIQALTGGPIDELKSAVEQISQTGIDASEASSGQVPVADGEGAWDWGNAGGVSDVQVNGTSVVNNGVANISLPKTQTVSGSTPSITGVADTRYICGEVSTLAVTAPASGIIDVVFESGSTPTVLTVTSAKSGVTAIKWAGGFDPTSLEADTTYELNILDGEYGVACAWT